MRKGRFNYVAGVMLIVGALMLYLGGGYYLIQTEGEPIAFYTITLCPFLVLSIGVAVAWMPLAERGSVARGLCCLRCW